MITQLQIDEAYERLLEIWRNRKPEAVKINWIKKLLRKLNINEFIKGNKWIK